MNEWNKLVNTWLELLPQSEEANSAWQAMLSFSERMKAKYG